MENRLEQFLTLKKELQARPFVRANINAQKPDGLKYWKYRLLRPFYKLKYLRFQKQNPSLPWLTPDSIVVLKKMIRGGKGLEFGSGRSTVFFSKLLNELDSVEHHQGWFDSVKESFEAQGISNVTLHHRPANGATEMPHLSSEQQVFLDEDQFPQKDDLFKNYINVLDQFEDESLDFILVDGRARKSCALRAGKKLKQGGLLVLDNSERIRYKEVHITYESWPLIQTTTGLTDTTIWIKP